MNTPTNILIAVDLRHGDRIADEELSPDAAATVRQGLEIAAATKAKVTFCAVIEVSEQAYELIRRDAKNVFVTVEDFAKKTLNTLVAQTVAQGISASYVVRIGSTWDQLLKQIEQERHDLVVVGTRKRSGMVRTLFGSTAQRLLRTAPCPVWIVKPDEVRDVREVLVATDLTSQIAVDAGVYVARILGAKLFVVHALEFPFEAYLHTAGLTADEIAKHRNRLHAEARQKLDAQLQKSDHGTLPYGLKAEVLEGSPDDVLGKYVVEHEIDLVVIGSQGHTGLSRILLGNTAERILPNVHASLLTVRTT